MTKRKLTPAKRGRKTKAPGEKLKQLTVRLPPTQRLGLELIAREHGLSLSEALDRVMAAAMSHETVAGQAVDDLISDLGGPDLAEPVTSIRREEVAEAILLTPPYLVMHLPATLRKPHEMLFADVYKRIVHTLGSSPSLVLGPSEVKELLEVCVTAQRRGASPDSLVEEWLPIFRDAHLA